MYSPPQRGGFEPATVALVASLLTTGVGALGVNSESKQNADAIQESASLLCGSADTAVKELKEKLDTSKRENQSLEQEIARLKREVESAKRSAATVQDTSGVAIAFKNASPKVLNAATDTTIAKLKSSATYPWMEQSELKNLRKALDYPGSYQGRLARMTLPAFFEKRIRPALEKDSSTRGGRRRRKRGGDGATAPTLPDTEYDPEAGPPVPDVSSTARTIPTYEEFATIYGDALSEASQSVVATSEGKKDTKRKTSEAQALVKRYADLLKKDLSDAEKSGGQSLPVAQALVKDFAERSSKVTPDTVDAMRSEYEEIRKTIGVQKTAQDYVSTLKKELKSAETKTGRSLFAEESAVNNFAEKANVATPDTLDELRTEYEALRTKIGEKESPADTPEATPGSEPPSESEEPATALDADVAPTRLEEAKEKALGTVSARLEQAKEKAMEDLKNEGIRKLTRRIPKRLFKGNSRKRTLKNRQRVNKRNVRGTRAR